MDTSEEVVARLGFEVLGFPVVSLRGLGLSSGVTGQRPECLTTTLGAAALLHRAVRASYGRAPHLINLSQRKPGRYCRV